MTLSLTYGLYLSAILFSAGLLTMIIKKNAVFVLIGIELILNAANLNLVVFSANDPSLKGQILTIFTIVIAASETIVALAILLNVYKHYLSSDIDQLNHLGN